MKRIFLTLGLILLMLTFSNILWADEWVEINSPVKPQFIPPTVYGLCPPGMPENHCFCDGNNKRICWAHEIVDPATGQCRDLTCPEKLSTPTGFTAGNEKPTLTDSEPINMATGEYFFFMDLFNLGGPLPLSYRIYYGSQWDWKIDVYDGFPSLPFSSNHGRDLRVYKMWSPQRAYVETGLGRQIGFTRNSTNWTWTVSIHERVRYQLQETTNYFYMLDPENDLLYSYA